MFAFTFFHQFLPRHGPVLGVAVTLGGHPGPGHRRTVLRHDHVLLASRARNWLSRATIRRRMERILGATLVCLGIDLAAAAR